MRRKYEITNNNPAPASPRGEGRRRRWKESEDVGGGDRRRWKDAEITEAKTEKREKTSGRAE